MQTIRSRFLTIICGVSLTLSMVFGALAVILVDHDETIIAARTLNGQAAHVYTTLNPIFIQSEDIVHYIGNTIEHEVKDPQELRDKAYRDRLEDKVRRSFYNAISGIDGVQGYYLHYNEDISGTPDGFWYARRNSRYDFTIQPITPVKAYGEKAVNRTNWYYRPLRTKQAQWLEPYINGNNGVRMITYVMPIFVKGQFVAVAGVDIDFNVLCDVVGAMKAYQDGYGFLFKDGQTVYFHPDGKGIEPDFNPDFMILQNGDLLQRSATEQKLIHYEYKGIPMALAFTTFRNGMKLAITAPADEIYAGRRTMIFLVLVITIVVGLGSTILAVKAADRIVRPLQDISAAARRLGRGEYDQPLDSSARDELGRLAGHMNDTMERMRQYVGSMKKQAYQDELTGVKNVAAYDMKVRALNRRIIQGQAAFAVVMVDLNQLKEVNDRFGHEKGNIALQTLCRAVCRLYKHSPVYRIGGDEFVVILEGEDYDNRDALFQKVQAFERIRDLKAAQPWTQLAASVGMAVYDQTCDAAYQAVFNRADTKMYEQKKHLAPRS
ncbi:sensor domain-containing diguanylate cyclase [Megasphaera elsdenii]|uniref:sensor domain-containing diguanylate cyclase n=1 Tax=Megasphaera elsdenii TaxID=907 RepID=UPI0033989A28